MACANTAAGKRPRNANCFSSASRNASGAQTNWPSCRIMRTFRNPYDATTTAIVAPTASRQEDSRALKSRYKQSRAQRPSTNARGAENYIGKEKTAPTTGAVLIFQDSSLFAVINITSESFGILLVPAERKRDLGWRHFSRQRFGMGN